MSMMSKETVKVSVLDFSNHLLQLKSISDGLNSLEATAKQSGGQLDVKHPQVSSLVDGLSSSTLSTAISCSTILTSALEKGWLNLPSFLSALVSQASSVHHYSVAIATIARALLWEMKILHQQQGYVCPYSLRINVHPFISILSSRPECGWCIVSELKQMCHVSSPSVALKTVEPFIKYVILHPNPTAEMSHVSCHLQSELVSMAVFSLARARQLRELNKPTAEVVATLQTTKAIVKLLVRLLPLQPSKSDQQLTSVTSMLEEVIQLILAIQGFEKGDGHRGHDELIDICFSYLCELTERSLPCDTLVEKLSLLFKHGKQCAPRHWLVLGWLILRNLLNPQSVAYLLQLCTFLISKPVDSFPAANLLLYPLVQLLAQPSTSLPPFASRDTILSSQKTASTLIKLIEGYRGDQLFATASDTPLSCSRIYSRLISTLCHFVEIDIQKLEEIAKQLTSKENLSSDSNDNYVLALSALAMMVIKGKDVGLVKCVLSALTAAAKGDASESPSILPFFLYLQSVTQNPQFKVSILHSIPSLATHRLASIGVVSTIQVLGSTPSLLPLATRLMGRVWQQQDHIFPYLNELLSRPLPPSLPPQLVDEITLIRAIVIRDICQLRAEVHGEDMLRHISRFLRKRSSNPLPVAMVIEGLVSLCHSEVIDAATLWAVLGNPRHSQWRMMDDNRPVVVTALCQLLELASEVDSDSSHGNKVFKVAALKYLWNCAYSKDSKVCSAAFRSLQNFQIEDYLPEHMPPKLRTEIGLSVSSDSGTSNPLTGRECVQLVQHIPLECAEAYGHFLTGLVKTELKGVQRGVVYSALREAQLPSQIERILHSTKELLPSLCTTNLAKDVASVGLIKGTMMTEFENERRSGRAGRQALSKELQQRLAMLEAFLREATIFTDVGNDDRCAWMGLSCLCVSKQWKTFVGRVLDTYCQLRLLETHSVSVEEESNNPIYLKKKREAADWSLVQVLDKLQSFASGNPDSLPNVLMALTGVIGKHCREVGSESFSHLLELAESFTAILLGSQQTVTLSSAAASVMQTLLGSSLEDLHLAVVISVAELVDSVLAVQWDGLDDTATQKLIALVDSLFEHYQRRPQWYAAVVLNQVFMRALPIVDSLKGIIAKMIPFFEASTKSGSLELLSLTAGLLPTLLLHGNHHQLAKSVLSVLQQKLVSLAESALSSSPAQVCCLHLANGAVHLYATGDLSGEEALQVVTVLAELASKAQKVVMLHFSLSLTLYGLGIHGHHSALSLADKIAVKWLQEAEQLLMCQEGDEVLPMLCGLSGFLGVNPLLGTESAVVVPSNLSFVKTLTPLVFNLLQKFVAHQDIVLCSSSVWLLSQAHLAVFNATKQEEKVPANYSYLPDDSTLNNLYLIMDSLSSPPHHPQKLEVLKHLLTSLVACREPQLPPANFSSLLLPLMTLRGELERRIIECLVSFRETQGLRQLGNYCCNPLIFLSLQMESKCTLLKGMVVLLVSSPLETFANFIHVAVNVSLHSLREKDQDSLLHSLMVGWADAYTSDSVTVEAKKFLSATLLRLFVELCGISKAETTAVNLNSLVLEKMATCLSHCDPAEVFLHCQIFSNSPVTLGSCLSSIMHCCLVRAGVRNTKMLTTVVGWILNNADHPDIVSPLCWLLQTISDSCSPKSCKSCEINQNNFMYIISSWIKATKFVSSSQVHILLLVVAAVCRALNCNVSRHLDVTTGSSFDRQDSSEGLQDLVKSQGQLDEPPQSQAIRDKLCQFLLELMKTSSVPKDKLVGLVLTLKCTEEFCDPTIWTTIAHWWQ